MVIPCAAAATAQIEATRIDNNFIFREKNCIRSTRCEVSTNSQQVPRLFIGSPPGLLLFQVDSGGGCMGTAPCLIIIKFIVTSLK